MPRRNQRRRRPSERRRTADPRITEETVTFQALAHELVKDKRCSPAILDSGWTVPTKRRAKTTRD